LKGTAFILNDFFFNVLPILCQFLPCWKLVPSTNHYSTIYVFTTLVLLELTFKNQIYATLVTNIGVNKKVCVIIQLIQLFFFLTITILTNKW